MLTLALKSLWSRRLTACLTLVAIAISVCLFLGVERIKEQTKESFSRTLSGTDLIVGARTGPLNLLLYSVFHLGDATNNIGWDSYQALRQQPEIAWSIPISLGDSHQGYRVVGTSPDYFKHYQYGDHTQLQFAEGSAFSGVFDAVVGAEVAQKLHYQLNTPIVIAHGAGKHSFSLHDNLPFRIVGILQPTGTPVDRSVLVSLASIEAIHLGWGKGAQQHTMTAAQALSQDLQPQSITAILVGLKSKIQTFSLQRTINTYQPEPLQAIMPGVALRDLWSLMSVAEKALAFVSTFVVVAGLTGMLTTLLAGLNERRRELAILRSLGATARHLFWLLSLEAMLLISSGMLLGLLLLYTGLVVLIPWIQLHYGLRLPLRWPTAQEYQLLGMIWLGGMFLGIIPAWRALSFSLHDGMTPRN
jgi:putative ABC transport system permease protein